MRIPNTLRNAARVVAVLAAHQILFAEHVVRLNAAPPAETVTLGISAPFTGPTRELGLNMRSGIEAAFRQCNAEHPQGNRRLALVSYDDGYEPARTAPNMRRLIEKDQVVGIIGNVGTPTAVAAIPISNETKTPFIGAFTGAGVLRKSPPDHYVINFRASYAEETAAMVDALVATAKIAPGDIGFFAQRDAYGDAGVTGGIAALKRHGLTDETAVPIGRYERNTANVEQGLADLLTTKPPRAIIMVGTAAPCGEFIKLARAANVKALFLNVSFVGGAALAQNLGSDGEGVVVTQVVPHFESNLPAILEYRAALGALDADLAPTHVSLEGYLAARMVLKAIDAIPGHVTRENLVVALEELKQFDLGIEETLALGPNDHQACHRVWPTVLSGGKVLPLEWSDLKVPQ